MTQGYELDDFLLVPQPSEVTSRECVNLITVIKYLALEIPIIASPMKGIVGVDMVLGMDACGGIGILPRFYNDYEQRLLDIARLQVYAKKFGVAVGLNDKCYIPACERGANIICIDVANGYLSSVVKFTEEVANYISSEGHKCVVMSGNVATYLGAKNLNDAGADLIRVGIGSGTLCTTRNNTGVGVPQATAIYECGNFMIKNRNPWWTVADGGIRNSGDAVKAFALGADFVMLGTILGSCLESDHNGKICGMASREFQEQFYGKVKKSVEGIQQDAEKTVKLSDFLNEFIWNIKSGFTYLNAIDIPYLHAHHEFVETGKGSLK